MEFELQETFADKCSLDVRKRHVTASGKPCSDYSRSLIVQ